MQALLLNKDFLFQNYVREELSTRAIAVMLGCSQTPVLLYLRKYGIKLRSSKEACRLWNQQHCPPKGYRQVHLPLHPMADKQGRVLEHRRIVEEVLGRLLEKNEVVHHRNGIPYDNRPKNLRVFLSQAEHCQFHRQFKKVSREKISTERASIKRPRFPKA